MSTPAEVAKIMAIMALAYPRYELRKESVDVYARLLSDLEVSQLELAAKHIMASSTFFPSIAEWRKAAFDITFNALEMPTPFEAWQIVMGEVRRIGSYGRPDISNPIISRAVDAIGWRVICLSEEPEYTRAHFVKAYEALLKRAEQEQSLLPDVRRAMMAGEQVEALTRKLSGGEK